MSRQIVVCSKCELQFLSRRERTICPSCHADVELTVAANG